MSLGKSDPLLRGATILINLGIIVLAAAAIIFILLLTVLAVSTLAGADAPPTRFLWTFGPLLVPLLVLGIIFLRTLRRIVASVDEGNPFTTVNADRLRAMAWLALSTQALTIVATLLSAYTGGKESGIEASINAFTGILMSLILFVLARVFRTGAEMRDELEGTV